MKRTTREWVQKAEADHRAAQKLSLESDRLPDQCCFFCQQSAEKYLKALLEELGLPVPRTHNLVAVQKILIPHHRSVRSLRRGADFLTRYAVDTRYPGEKASRRQAVAAIRWAGKVRDVCRQILGL